MYIDLVFIYVRHCCIEIVELLLVTFMLCSELRIDICFGACYVDCDFVYKVLLQLVF